MSVTIKAYLLGKDDVHKEIRRFAVDEGVSTSFEYLTNKVVDVFSNLRNIGFQMYYRGELSLFVVSKKMCFCSEMQYAVRNSPPK